MAWLLPLPKRLRQSQILLSERAGVVAMDVGITKSEKNHPIHLITGLLVITVSYSAVMFAVRAIVLGV
jgi:hypothetical protein